MTRQVQNCSDRCMQRADTSGISSATKEHVDKQDFVGVCHILALFRASATELNNGAKRKLEGGKNCRYFKTIGLEDLDCSRNKLFFPPAGIISCPRISAQKTKNKFSGTIASPLLHIKGY